LSDLASRLDLSLSVEIRPLGDWDLEGLEWDSEQAIQADYIRKTLAERGEEVVFLLALANGQPVGKLGIDFGRKAAESIVQSAAGLPQRGRGARWTR
jgi:hypothetical protein